MVDNYLKEKYSVTPTLKVSQSTRAASAKELVTDIRDGSMKPVRLAAFSRSGYTVVTTTNESDCDRLLTFDDDPGFDTEAMLHVIQTEDSQTSSSNTA